MRAGKLLATTLLTAALAFPAALSARDPDPHRAAAELIADAKKDLDRGAYDQAIHELELAQMIEGNKEVDTLIAQARSAQSAEKKMAARTPRGGPLTLAEIDEGLRAGMTSARLSSLVRRYGVDFVLDDEHKKQLESAGASPTLLQQISRSKR